MLFAPLFEFVDFADLEAGNSIKQLNKWHQQFMLEKIQPIFLEKAKKVVDIHKKNGDRTLGKILNID
jgi:phosphoserine phosphatase